MPFQSPWSRVPLRLRWMMSLLIAAACVAALVLFVSHHDSNGEVGVSAQKMRAESMQADIVIGQEQAAHAVTVASGVSVRETLARAVRRDMNAQIRDGVSGPLQSVRCVVHGGTYARTGYHCLARAADVYYPFLAVATAADHRVVYCEKIEPPSPTENIPVSRRCRAPAS